MGNNYSLARRAGRQEKSVKPSCHSHSGLREHLRDRIEDGWKIRNARIIEYPFPLQAWMNKLIPNSPVLRSMGDTHDSSYRAAIEAWRVHPQHQWFLPCICVVNGGEGVKYSGKRVDYSFHYLMIRFIPFFLSPCLQQFAWQGMAWHSRHAWQRRAATMTQNKLEVCKDDQHNSMQICNNIMK